MISSKIKNQNQTECELPFFPDIMIRKDQMFQYDTSEFLNTANNTFNLLPPLFDDNGDLVRTDNYIDFEGDKLINNINSDAIIFEKDEEIMSLKEMLRLSNEKILKLEWDNKEREERESIIPIVECTKDYETLYSDLLVSSKKKSTMIFDLNNVLSKSINSSIKLIVASKKRKREDEEKQIKEYTNLTHANLYDDDDDDESVDYGNMNDDDEEEKQINEYTKSPEECTSLVQQYNGTDDDIKELLSIADEKEATPEEIVVPIEKEQEYDLYDEEEYGEHEEISDEKLQRMLDATRKQTQEENAHRLETEIRETQESDDDSMDDEDDDESMDDDECDSVSPKPPQKKQKIKHTELPKPPQKKQKIKHTKLPKPPQKKHHKKIKHTELPKPPQKKHHKKRHHKRKHHKKIKHTETHKPPQKKQKIKHTETPKPPQKETQVRLALEYSVLLPIFNKMRCMEKAKYMWKSMSSQLSSSDYSDYKKRIGKYGLKPLCIKSITTKMYGKKYNEKNGKKLIQRIINEMQTIWDSAIIYNSENNTKHLKYLIKDFKECMHLSFDGYIKKKKITAFFTAARAKNNLSIQ